MGAMNVEIRITNVQAASGAVNNGAALIAIIRLINAMARSCIRPLS
jgi:hypothetical protein